MRGTEQSGRGDIRIAALAEQDAVGEAEIVELWTREAGLTAAQARERLPEVMLVAATPEGALAGVSTAYLAHSHRLGMEMWHFRVFVASAHRRGDVALRLARGARDRLRDRFVAGEDRRGAGMVFEVEHAGLRRRDHAVWPHTGFAFIGANRHGSHVRIQFFPGARAPAAASIGDLPGPSDDWTTEVLRGRLDAGWEERVLRFWADHGALTGEEARRRLPDVVAVLRDGDGELAGVSSVFADAVPLVGGRRFWVFRSFVVPRAARERIRLIAAAFHTLAQEFDPSGGGPIGLCALLGPQDAALHPEALWSEPPMLYAGYLADGRQVRVGYFPGASIARD